MNQRNRAFPNSLLLLMFSTSHDGQKNRTLGTKQVVRRKTMRAQNILAVALTAVFLTTTAQAESRLLLQNEAESAGAGTVTKSVQGATRPTTARAAKALLDDDGNGLSDGLDAHLATVPGNTLVDVIVSTTGPGLASVLQQGVGPFAVKHEYQLVDGFSATVSAGQARALAAQRDVRRVEEDVMVQGFLEASRPDFGIEDLTDHGNPGVAGLTGAGVKVCVADSGAQGDHEEFVEAGFSRIIAFRDFVGDYLGDTSHLEPYDDSWIGHGTHVTSIIGGDGTSDLGAPGADPLNAGRAKGGAPGVELIIAKVLNHNGSGPDSGIVAAIEWCVEQGADIINLSLGIAGETLCQDILCVAVEAAVDQGVIVTAAAGNAGDAPGTIGSPGVSGKAITVGAIADFSANPLDPWHSSGAYTTIFSSQGPGVNGTIKPDLLGPGASILSAINNDWVLEDSGFFFIGTNECGVGCYSILDGTSQAAPYVAAVAALMLEANPSLTPAEVKQILTDTAVDRLMTGPDNITGYGMVDAAAAVTEAYRRLDASVAVMTNDVPTQIVRTGKIRKNSSIDIPITVDDRDLPLAITVAIQGELACRLEIGGACAIIEWDPDIDARLYEGDPDNGGTLVFESLCPAAGDAQCVDLPTTAVGQLETLYVEPPLDPSYTLHLFAVQDTINLGAGGNVTYDISNGTTGGGGGGGGRGGGKDGGNDGGGGGGKPCNPRKEVCP
jgi:serine protease AprX